MPSDDEAAAETTVAEQARQGAILDHGLDRQSRTSEDDAELMVFVDRAQRYSGADIAIVFVLDGPYEVVVATSLPLPVRIVAREQGLVEWVLRQGNGDRVFATADAAAHPALQLSSLVNGTSGKVRFFAAAPLIDRDGIGLGALCLLSPRQRDDFEEGTSRLSEVRDDIMATLEARRAVPSRPQLDPSSPRHPTADGTERNRDSPIDLIIDQRAVHTLFQPIVHLQTGAVVGFEAFARGPAGTPLESPLALISAAHDVGRLGELDWVCRVNAMEAATASGLHPSISWFINVEPAGLELDCPEDLRPAYEYARRDLRIVLEVIDRVGNSYLPSLLRASDRARRDAWGVAVNLNADGSSVGLLPFLQPDALKLAIPMLRQVRLLKVAEATAAVRAYAERRGAVIIGEGIETEEEQRLAQFYGATYGQGYRFGKPEPLPESTPAPRDPIPLVQRPMPLVGDTPFEVLAQSCTVTISPKHLLVGLAAHLESHSVEHNEACALLTCFQRAEFFGARSLTRYRQLATRNAYTLVLAEGLEAQTWPGLQIAPLKRSSRMCQEWVTIVVGPHYAAALVAQDIGDRGADADRRYKFIYTHDRSKVINAARSYLGHLTIPPSVFDAPPPVREPGRGRLRR
ncbi:MAG: Phytochrome-like protein cph2 [Frankiales bacterium]|nr:Phytochrome-like protein cph2 [Frankiales bacterium]